MNCFPGPLFFQRDELRSYRTDLPEIRGVFRGFFAKNPSGTAFAPFAKRIQHGRPQVTALRSNESAPRGGVFSNVKKEKEGQRGGNAHLFVPQGTGVLLHCFRLLQTIAVYYCYCSLQRVTAGNQKTDPGRLPACSALAVSVVSYSVAMVLSCCTILVISCCTAATSL